MPLNLFKFHEVAIYLWSKRGTRIPKIWQKNIAPSAYKNCQVIFSYYYQWNQYYNFCHWKFNSVGMETAIICKWYGQRTLDRKWSKFKKCCKKMKLAVFSSAYHKQFKYGKLMSRNVISSARDAPKRQTLSSVFGKN